MESHDSVVFKKEQTRILEASNVLPEERRWRITK